MAKGSKTGPDVLEKRLMMETRATICEFAFSLLSPTLRGHFRGDIELKGDGGWDYQLASGRRIDVKSGPPQAISMIVGEKNMKTCDTLVMSRYLDRIKQVEFMGWIDCKDVPKVGKPGNIETWRGKPHLLVFISDLRPMEELAL